MTSKGHRAAGSDYRGDTQVILAGEMEVAKDAAHTD